MSLRHSILGFLSKASMTGYDLQKKVDSTIRHFWPATQSQIYRTLKELEESGLIASEIHYQEQKPNKRVYQITAAGKEQLRQWLSSPIPIDSPRHPLLVQLFFSAGIPPATLCENLRAYRATMEERLSFLESPEAEAQIDRARNAREHELYELIRDNGLMALRNEIAWAEKSLERLGNLRRRR